MHEHVIEFRFSPDLCGEIYDKGEDEGILAFGSFEEAIQKMQNFLEDINGGENNELADNDTEFRL